MVRESRRSDYSDQILENSAYARLKDNGRAVSLEVSRSPFGKGSTITFGLDETDKTYYAITDLGDGKENREATPSEVIALAKSASINTPEYDHLGILRTYADILRNALNYLGF